LALLGDIPQPVVAEHVTQHPDPEQVVLVAEQVPVPQVSSPVLEVQGFVTDAG
jgi:hypothetical protein